MDRLSSHWQEWADLVLGLLLLISPWALGFASGAVGTMPDAADVGPVAAWNAWICGIIIAATALAAILRFDEWTDWVNGLLGLWVIIAPWVLGFTGLGAAVAAHVVLGVLIVAFSAWDLWAARHPPSRITQA